MSAATGTYGGTSTTFTATLTSGGNPVVGKTITFTLNGNSAGSGVTNASGVATSGTVTLCGSSYNVSGSPYATGAAASWAGDVSFAGTSGTNSLTVAKANATFTVTPYTVTYDGQSHTATVSTITGVCDETGATVGTVHLPAGHVNAGTYNGQFETWTFTGGPNYNDIAATQLTDVINKKDATWTTNAKSKTYGDNDPNPVTTGSGSGFLAGDNVTATYSRATGETVTGGPYHITATLSPSGVLSNYNITNAGADFAINAKNATWTTNPNSKTYGDTDPNPLTTGSGSGFLAGDNVTATYGRVAGETVAGGPYHITATLSPSGVLSNYNITNNGADFTINAKNATWTTEPNSKTYGDDDPTPLTIGSGTGFLAADNVTATYSRAAGETVAGGPYHITTTLSPAGVLTNYNITNNGANFSINPKTATWTTNPNSKTYGDNDPNPLTTGSGSGFLAADNVTATYSRAAGETVAGGPYHITATLSPAGVLSNYTITNTGAGFSINKANATVVVTPYSVTYDGNPHTATYTINGVNGESGNTVGTIDVGGTTHTNAGTYNNDPWTFTGGPDYNDTSGTVNDAIAKADATINVTPYHVTYDANPHTATGTATGVGGVDLSASLTLTGTTHTTAGDYPGDAWSFAGGTNYNDASGTVHDIIDKANATINVTPYHVTYDANPHTGTGTATGVGGVHLSASLTLTGTTHTTAGDYPSDAWSFAGGPITTMPAGRCMTSSIRLTPWSQ